MKQKSYIEDVQTGRLVLASTAGDLQKCTFLRLAFMMDRYTLGLRHVIAIAKSLARYCSAVFTHLSRNLVQANAADQALGNTLEIS